MQLIIMHDANMASSHSFPISGWQGTFQCRHVGNAGMEPSETLPCKFKGRRAGSAIPSHTNMCRQSICPEVQVCSCQYKAQHFLA